MTDPVSAEMANQAVQSAGTQETQPGEGAADFSEAMANPDAEQVMETQAGEDIEAPEAGEAVEAVGEIPTDDFVQRLLQEESEIQQMMQSCLNGAEVGQQEMLQMQAVIYSYSQRVDLTTKVVENATSGVKDVMNTQV